MTHNPLPYGTWTPNDYRDLRDRIVALSDCLGVDDSLFSYTLRRGDKTPGGAVIIGAEVI